MAALARCAKTRLHTRMQAQDEAAPEYEIARLATRSFDDEFGSTIDNDVLLLQAAIFGIAAYTYIAISNCRDGCVGSRALLTIGGVPRAHAGGSPVQSATHLAGVPALFAVLPTLGPATCGSLLPHTGHPQALRLICAMPQQLISRAQGWPTVSAFLPCVLSAPPGERAQGCSTSASPSRRPTASAPTSASSSRRS